MTLMLFAYGVLVLPYMTAIGRPLVAVRHWARLAMRALP